MVWGINRIPLLRARIQDIVENAIKPIRGKYVHIVLWDNHHSPGLSAAIMETGEPMETNKRSLNGFYPWLGGTPPDKIMVITGTKGFNRRDATLTALVLNFPELVTMVRVNVSVDEPTQYFQLEEKFSGWFIAQGYQYKPHTDWLEDCDGFLRPMGRGWKADYLAFETADEFPPHGFIVTLFPHELSRAERILKYGR